MSTLHAWIDASGGVAGDMLLGALIDAGARLPAVQSVVEAVLPATVRLETRTVQRAGMRATKLDVRTLVADHPHRTWRTIRTRIEEADIPAGVRDRSLATFARLADAEGRVHGVAPDEVHFHEVGAWDSIADVVGTCAALEDLRVASLSVSTIALGSGRIRAAHGEIPVPVPAVLALSEGWSVTSGGDGELATPTGMALVTALATRSEDLPALRVGAVGIGAGTRDTPGRPNVVRVVLGLPDASTANGSTGTDASTRMWVLETNVDDLDPRVWPTVLAALLEAGAADAWLVPIVMKKGRPAHTLAVLADAGHRAALRTLVFALTSTIGVREVEVARTALDRLTRTVPVAGGAVRVKVAHVDGVVVHATPEFDDVAALADSAGVPVRGLLASAVAAVEHAGLVPGARVADLVDADEVVAPT
ncbi:nickel pincer cofactor biosynthesis protein LarC [Cellulomonas sp.]|uniref:nickel pincer cofactor biosynthesis protein LarC n=1 Tax=Cellulomonas sp. TaxID=40001 RepID=UPI002E326889|nr:nickel pincer cofactor biosynthesis protein LarC [Cellulomonas sp.]